MSMNQVIENSGNEIRGFSRRFAQMPIPGINEPRIVSGIEIPIVPLNVPTTTNNGQVYPSKNERKRIQRNSRFLENQINEGEIELVEFNLFTTEEIDTYAVVNITEIEDDKPNSLSDLKMGPHGEGADCETCGSDIRGCPGHFGKIIIPPIMHPLSEQAIILTLSCICYTCSRLLITQQDIQNAGIARFHGVQRLEAIRDLVRKIERDRKKGGRRCQHGVLGHGGISCESNPIYSTVRGEKSDYRLGMYRKKKSEYQLVGYLTPEMIYARLDAIPNEDALILGFTLESHPRTMIMYRLLVIPYCARPDLYQGGLYNPDDITKMYKAILRETIKYNKNLNNPSERELSHAFIFRLVGHLMKNDSKFNQNNLRVQSDIYKRVGGKGGIIRGNLMGKRVDFAGRTVVGPGHTLRVDELGVPRLMAVKLTRPIRVYENNRAEMQAKYDSGRVRHITMQSGFYAGRRLMIGDWFRQRYPNYKVQTGDILERILEDGDIVLVNRQPSLHKQNILALYARIIDDRIARINLSITTPLNADFDGDELNIHIPQTIEAYAEAEQLLAVHRNLISGQTNKPMMGIVYDTLSGAYLLSYPEEEVERLDREIIKLIERQTKVPIEIQALRIKMSTVQPETPQMEDFISQMSELENETVKIIEKIVEYEQRQAIVKERIDIDPYLFNMIIENVEDAPQYETLVERLNFYGINPHGGRALLSACFPDNFNYKGVDPNTKSKVKISNGILVRGFLTKDSLGNKDGSIIAEMVKQLGGIITVDFMTDIQFVVKDFLRQHGLSVGIEDCMPNDPLFRQNLDEILTNAKLKVVALSGKPSNQIIAEQQERKIGEALDIAKNEGDKIMQKYFLPDNALIIMSDSGAKGTIFNAVQMTAALGQQKVSGKRILSNLSGNRSLPSVEPGSADPLDKGFCSNSFSSGLEPKEFFFHAQGGREGLTDTAINTAQTGYLQHQIVKSAEDVHISPDGSVRSGDNAIIQFIYGDDGFDASELGTIKIHGENVPFFRNIQQLANSINNKYESRV